MAELTCGGSCMKYILFFFNILFWIQGVALLALGIWIAVDPNINKYLEVVNVDFTNPMMKVATYVIIGVGAFVFLVGFLGCCGACRESSCMLCLYAGLLVIVLLAEVAAGVLALVFRRQLGVELKDSMANQARRNVTTNPKDSLTLAWNAMQYELKCCGGNNYMDYWGSKFANDTTTLATIVPPTCCKLKNNDPNNPQPENSTVCQEEAELDPVRPKTQLNTAGCYDSLLKWLKSKSAILIGIGIGLAVLQILGIVFACGVRKQILKSDYESKY